MNGETSTILSGDTEAADARRPTLIRFDRYVLDRRCGVLRVGEADIDLRPKTFAVLGVLVENAGRLVSKDEIIAAVWPETGPQGALRRLSTRNGA
jgi:DNA-binding response OmpR family regulator